MDTGITDEVKPMNMEEFFERVAEGEMKPSDVPILAFGRALRQVIEDCFLKFGMEVVEWCVICGNPIERSYDRMCEKLGGRIIGVRHRRALDMAGNVHNDKSYEILREDFLRAVGKHE